MSQKWDIDRVRQLAGMAQTNKKQLTESYDDDEDPDVRIAMSDKKQREFETGNKKDLDDGGKAADARKTSQSEKKEEVKQEPKQEKKDDKKPAEPKKEEAAEAKKRGKTPNPESFNQHAKANANKRTRGQFIQWAADNHGKGKNYASALFARYNPKSSRQVSTPEAWIIVHPSMPSFLLAENREMNQFQWVEPSSNLIPLVFETQADAKKTQKYISEWKGQSSVLEKIIFDAEDIQ